MQFEIIIENDPIANANAISLDHLKAFQVREGYQIASDIGHNLRVWWNCQNAPYSIWHAETRRFMLTKSTFNEFYQNLLLCAERLGTKSWIDKIAEIPVFEITDRLPTKRTPGQLMAEMMLRTKRVSVDRKTFEIKRVRMTDDEVSRYVDIMDGRG